MLQGQAIALNTRPIHQLLNELKLNIRGHGDIIVYLIKLLYWLQIVF